MAALFDEIVALLASKVTVRSIADDFPEADVPSLGTASVLGVPAVIAKLTDSLDNQGTSEAVLGHLRTIDPTTVTANGSTADPESNRIVGDQVADLLFGHDGRGRLAEAVSAETGISYENATAVLPTSSWAVLASVARRYGNQLDATSLATILAREHQDLLTNGWSTWIEEVSPPHTHSLAATPAATSNMAAYPPPGKAVDPIVAEALEVDQELGLPEAALGTGLEHQAAGLDSQPLTHDLIADPGLANSPSLDSAGASSFDANSFEASSHPDSGEAGTASEDLLGIDRHQRRPVAEVQQMPAGTERQVRNARGGVLPLIGGALLIFGALFGIGFLQSRGESTRTADGGEVAATENEEADPAAPSEEAEATAPAEDASDDAGAAEAETAAEPAVLQTEYSIDMEDPLQRTEANGTVSLDFDFDANQVCYRAFTSGIGEPYEGHIHVGPAGVKGGIVVDFGFVTSGSDGCVNVAPTDMEFILDQPANHYVEMHDPVEEFTIRAQLSDEPVALSESEGAMELDPTGEGAVTIISDNQILLEGQVPDQETMDFLVSEVSGLDDSRILVVNDLVITPGADLPTGLVTISDSILFETDSDQLTGDPTVIQNLALLFIARSDWTMTIAGHTDNVGDDVDNLELSLRRADAVRQALVDLGVPGSRLRTTGFGARQPTETNETEAGRALNRRIEFQVERN